VAVSFMGYPGLNNKYAIFLFEIYRTGNFPDGPTQGIDAL
jgi:hypothetical protein